MTHISSRIAGAIFLISLCGADLLTAELVFSENFSFPDPGKSASPVKWSPGGFFKIHDDGANPVFPAGSRFARIGGSPVTLTRPKIDLSNPTVVTFAFDLLEPVGGGDAPFKIGFTASDTLGGDGAAMVLEFNQGMIRPGANATGTPISYIEGGLYRFHVVYNRSASHVSYKEFPADVSSTSLPVGAAVIYYARLDTGWAFGRAGRFDATRNVAVADRMNLEISVPEGMGKEFDIDNVVIYNTVRPTRVAENPAPDWQPGFGWRSDLYPASWKPPGPALQFYVDPFIQDYSRAGYQSGDAGIPSVASPRWIATEPPFSADPTGATDSTLAIQAALNAAGEAGGGVVYLPEGKYDVSPQGGANHALLINRPNVILRGAGAGKTYLFNTSSEMREKQVILVEGDPAASLTSEAGSSTLIRGDLRGPTTVIPVTDATLFAAGDWVTIRADATDSWVSEHQVANWRGQGAVLGGFAYRRKVTEVDRTFNSITVDIATRYAILARDRGRVVRTDRIGITGVGLEDFSVGIAEREGTTWGENSYANSEHSAWHAHLACAVRIQRAQDCWMDRVETYLDSRSLHSHLLSNGVLVKDSIRVTLRDCVMQRAQYGGAGGNGYMYRVDNSSDCLLVGCTASTCRHGFVLVGMRCSGNVLHKCLDRETSRQQGATGNQSAGSSGSDHHAHFSHSNLVDQCQVDRSFFTAHYRPFGTTPLHEITASHSVFWNITGEGYLGGSVVRSEQVRYGYVIGCKSASAPTGGGTRMLPADWFEGTGRSESLEPPSLYRSQVERRIPSGGAGAVGDWRRKHFGVQAALNAIAGNSADPDGDGTGNLIEFAFDRDPASPDEDTVEVSPRGIDGVEYLTLTAPFRKGAVFEGPGDLVSKAADGLIYWIQASGDLDDFESLNVVEVIPALAGDRPAPTEGWEYRTFRLETPINQIPRAFMQARIIARPE